MSAYLSYFKKHLHNRPAFVTPKHNLQKDPQGSYSYPKPKAYFASENEQLFSVSDAAALLPIQTSKYQMQFLRDPFIVKNKNLKHRIHFKPNEPSLIFEQTLKIVFPFSGEIQAKVLHDSLKMYYALPIDIETDNISITETPTNIVGIDVGEYGLGYVVVNQEAKILTRGFIYDSALRKIRDRYQEIQKRQRVGVFSMQNTALAAVREQAIHAIRNKIHDLVVRYKAKPVYEYSISNFETGSGRVTTIYRSVKKADVPKETDTDAAVINHTWGTKKALGAHLSSYGTSYACTKCKQSIYALSFEMLEIHIEKNPENSKELLVRLYDQKTGIEAATLYAFNHFITDPPTTIFSQGDRKAVLAMIKAYARPPLDALPAGIFGSSQVMETFKKARGNSAVFRCPFVGCGHISDADVQAAYIIALKALLREKGIVKKTKEDGNEISALLQAAHDGKYSMSTISLNVEEE